MAIAGQLGAGPAPDSTQAGMVLSKAVIRAAAFLDLPNKIVARAIGLSEASVSRLKSGTYVVSRDTKTFELAQLFVRLFRSLDSIMGGDDEASRSWMRTHNIVLGERPIELIQKISGLLTVLQYVDSRRAPL